MNLLIAIVAAALGFVSAWQLQAHQITKLELNYANERTAVARAARATLERVTGQVQKAQANATTRATGLRVAAAGTASSGNGLRVTSAAAVRTAGTAACSDTAAALGAVFDQCSTELQSLAEIADRHASDLQTMNESWPK